MFGIWGHPKAAEITYYGLHAMQHRGQDGAGIVVSDGEQLKLHKDIGLVNDVFKRVEFDRLNGFAAIGHVRNATQDDGNFDNVQPLVFRSLKGSTAIAHNGKIMNAKKIRSALEESGDRKSTRLNSSHVASSYAVFCLKKKNVRIGEYARDDDRRVQDE